MQEPEELEEGRYPTESTYNDDGQTEVVAEVGADDTSLEHLPLIR